MDKLSGKLASNLDTNYNPSIRDNFVKEVAISLPKNSRILDISSGTKPYKKFFDHCQYITHEFSENKNIIDDFRKETSADNKIHDIYSPIDNIPVDDNTFDFLICTEVFEHIPEPIKAKKELVRICKPGGSILITAPFTSGIHQQPYHFYSGFSPFFYNYLKNLYNLNITKFKSQGDLFLLNHQEISRWSQHGLHPILNKDKKDKELFYKIIDFIKKYLLNMSKLVENEIKQFDTAEKMMETFYDINCFTIGYCVLFEKKNRV